MFLDRIKAIAFTDSEHFIEPNNIQTQRGTLGAEQIQKLEDAAVHWRRMYTKDGSPEPVDTLEYELSDYHGCRVVSAGTDDHSSTNFMATPSIIRFFETKLPIARNTDTNGRGPKSASVPARLTQARMRALDQN